jgi:hypothetical protein
VSGTDRPAALPSWGTVRREAWCFIGGSALFAAGAGLAALSGLSPHLVGGVCFAGSVLFTTAALVQLSLADRTPPAPARRRHVAVWRLDDRQVDRLAAGVQLVGTVLFNINTLRAALLSPTSPQAANRLIWVPDAFGSVAFLLASALACLPEVRRRRHTHVRGRSWWIALLNLVGSVLFGIAAAGALLLPGSGSPVNPRWVNAGTGFGALCFLAGAALLLPHRRVTRRTGGGPAHRR